MTINTKALSGFMELLPEQQLVFDHLRTTIERIYQLNGYTPMDQPLIERAEVLDAKGGDEAQTQMYRFTKGDTDLALRFDHTVPFARYVANNYGQITLPFRRYTIGKVYRGERAQAGRFREFYQCDIDIVDQDQLDLSYDAQMTDLINQVFSQLDLGAFVIRINNRKLLNGLFAAIGVSNLSADILRIIDKREKISPDQYRQELLDLGLSPDQFDQLHAVLDLDVTDPLDKLAQLGQQTFPHPSDQFQTGLDELQTVLQQSLALGVPATNLRLDLSIARGLDYYTGTVYETELVDHPDIGSVCSGGRYDNLAAQYSNRTLPGVGISIGLTRLFDQLMRREVLTPATKTSPTQLLILALQDDLGGSQQLASQLRAAGVAVEIDMRVGKKLDKRFNYANKLGVPYVAIVGSTELEQGVFTLRDMTSGQEEQLGVEGVVERLRV